MTRYRFRAVGVDLYHGDALDVLRRLPDASVDSIVTDPPYGISFMGKAWDGPGGMLGQMATGHEKVGALAKGGTHSRGYADNDNVAFGAWCLLWTTECHRVLKPGGHLLAFGGTRTWHRLTAAVEDAGFEIRDSIAWLYGSGFPKSMDVSKAIDKAKGATGTLGGPKSAAHAGWIDRGAMRGQGGSDGHAGWQSPWMDDPEAVDRNAREYLPGSAEARAFKGWGTALKPAFEPIVVGRKPLAKGSTVAKNVLAHGTGALNIDGCRVPTDDKLGGGHSSAGQQMADGWHRPWMDDPAALAANAERSRASVAKSETLGRWPANVLLDGFTADELDEQSGTLTSRKAGAHELMGYMGADVAPMPEIVGSSGGASRYFPVFRYQAKAPTRERPKVDGVAHPTVKPLALMQWLVRLVTPPGGVVLEPFAGSGTTVEACVAEGFGCIAIEREAEYLPLIAARMARVTPPDDEGEAA